MTHYEYKVVSIAAETNIQKILDDYSSDGWRLVQTLETMGYSTRLIFERTHEFA